MCIVSMVYDKYGLTDLSKWSNWTIDTVTNTVSPPKKAPLDLFEELVEVAKRLDQALGLADCEDPSKMEWLEKVKKQVKDHEVNKIENRLSKCSR